MVLHRRLNGERHRAYAVEDSMLHANREAWGSFLLVLRRARTYEMELLVIASEEIIVALIGR